jgi:thioredoxin reductase
VTGGAGEVGSGDGDEIADIAILGAGPVGLFGAYYAGFRGLRSVVVDALDQIGGQVTTLYPEKLIHDVAGFIGIPGRELIQRLGEQADQYAPSYVLGSQVTGLTDGPHGPELETSTGTRIKARAVIVAGGVGAFTPRSHPALERHVGRGVEYFVSSLQAYAGQNVIVVGGGDSACDWAVALSGLARSVTVVHRRAGFRAHAATVAKLEQLPVELLRNSEIMAASGETWLDEVTIRDMGTQQDRVVKPDAVIAALGFHANLGPIATWGLELENRRIVVDRQMATSRERVWASGDITTYPGKVPLIAVGFGEIATAVNNAAIAIDPDSPLFFGHSTDSALSRLGGGGLLPGPPQRQFSVA